jgi:phosphatidylglycerol:prolipoprotein diacylglycerol transferase
LYESLWNLAGFALLMIVGRKYGKRLLPGEILMLYVVYYGIGRFIFEGLKPEVWTLAGFPTARWVVIAAILVVAVITVVRRVHLSRAKPGEA